MRPLKQITGEAEFNEVFTKMSAYHATTWSAICTTAGWSVLACSCTSGPPSILAQANLQVLIKDLMDLARQRAKQRSYHSAASGHLYAESEAVKYYGYRSLTKRLRGLRPGPEGSVHRLALTRLSQQAQELAMELQGPIHSSCMARHVPSTKVPGNSASCAHAQRPSQQDGGDSEKYHRRTGARTSKG